MAKNDYELIETGGAPVKAWIKGVECEPNTRAQIEKVSRLPFVHGVALMPDCHLGIGCTVGSVVATKEAIVPACVGVDIGCGVVAARLPRMAASDLPDNLHAVRSAIEAVVPHGRTDKGRVNDRGAWGQVPDTALHAFKNLSERLESITQKHPKIVRAAQRAPHHMGTLGTGNHFIEICLDEAQGVWVMLHSGSRGIGNAIGTYFIERAKEHMRRLLVNLPDVDLSYLPENTQDFDDYIEALLWSQDFAAVNRQVMLNATIKAICDVLGRDDIGADSEATNCHHNYAALEQHHGKDLWVTRKGAVRAREGDLGIIPGSMGAKSYIVRGKGNPDSYHSCSHGAGRRMGRNEAKKKITLERHIKMMKGIEARLDADVIDESPDAYKDIDNVMKAQTDLVEVVHTLRQIVNVKG